MPLKGRKRFRGTCLVFDRPKLPYPLWNGDISYSEALSREPTATITYQGIPEGELRKLERAYQIGDRLSLYGIPMEVVGLGWQQEDVIRLDRDYLVVYTVTVNLQLRSLALIMQQRFGGQWPTRLEQLEEEADAIGFFAYADGQRPKALGSGRRWRFTREQILEVGSSSLGLPSEGYNAATLTWGGDDRPENSPRATFSPARPVIETLSEGSDDLSLMPTDTKALRDTSSNFDESGPTKFLRTVTRVDGTPDTEHYELWGFAYLLEDIVRPDGNIRGDNPQAFWQMVEETDTTNIYQPVEASTLQVEIRDPSRGAGGEGPQMSFVVHPDFERFLTVVGSTGALVTVKTATRYLVETTTRGRKLVRLVKETEERGTLEGDADPRYELYQFRWIPFWEKTVYLLAPARGTFIEGDESLPFRVEFQDYESLEPRIKARIPSNRATKDGRVAILYPEINYVEPFYIQRQQQQANSYLWELDPDGEVEEAEFPDDPPKPPPHFQVGQETENLVRRIPTDLSTKQYVEVTSEYTAQDPQFEAVAQRVSFREQRGQPPSPQIRQIRFEPDTVDDRPSRDRALRYVVTTPDNSARFPEGGSLNIPAAKSLQAAIAALRVRLRRSGLESNQGQYQVQWFYPTMRAGDTITLEGDRRASQGRWIVTQLSWKLVYAGGNATLGLGKPEVSCPDGMNLTLGLDRDRPITVGTRTDPSGSEPTINARVVGSPGPVGRILPPLPNRRNF